MKARLCAVAALFAAFGLASSAAQAADIVRLGNLKFAHYGAVSYMKEICPKYGIKVEERMLRSIKPIAHHYHNYYPSVAQ